MPNRLRLPEELRDLDPNTPLFPEDALVRLVNDNGLLLFGGHAALLKQLADPRVADGVARKSKFRENPFGRVLDTLNSMYGIARSTIAEAQAESQRLYKIHSTVKATDGSWRATDPDLYQWVLTTLIETALDMHSRLMRPLSPEGQQIFYRESLLVMELLGVSRDRFPLLVTDFLLNTRSKYSTMGPEVSDDAREIADAVFAALPRKLVFRSIAMTYRPFAKQITAGLLDDEINKGYGLEKLPVPQHILTGMAMISRQLSPLVPQRVLSLPGVLAANIGRDLVVA